MLIGVRFFRGLQDCVLVYNYKILNFNREATHLQLGHDTRILCFSLDLLINSLLFFILFFYQLLLLLLVRKQRLCHLKYLLVQGFHAAGNPCSLFFFFFSLPIASHCDLSAFSYFL